MTRAVLAVIFTVVTAAFVWAMIDLGDSIDTYDQRFTDCMEIKKSYIWPHRYFTEPEYQAWMDDCDQQASQ